MAKPTALTPDVLTASAATSPTAATTPRGATKNKPAQPKPVPLQVRWPREDVKAIKVAAAEAEQTISEFMLACLHASAQVNAGKRNHATADPFPLLETGGLRTIDAMAHLVETHRAAAIVPVLLFAVLVRNPKRLHAMGV